MTLRIGILGCGRIGQVHARAIKATEGATVMAVADALPEAAAGSGRHHRGPRCVAWTRS